MDPPWGSFTSKASSIPRLSRLPLPCAAPVRSVRPSPSREKLSADKGLNISKLQSTSSRDTISWSTSPKPQIRQNAVVSGLHPKATAPASSKVKGPESISGHDAVEDPPMRPTPHQQEPLRPLSQQTERRWPTLPPQDAVSLTSEAVDEGSSATPIVYRKSRPSLSDRTIETLSQIPPSPSPGRRQSSFYPTDSPMRPPSRPASALNHSRPSSSLPDRFSRGIPSQRPASPSKRLPAARSDLQRPDSASTTPSKRAVSSFVSGGASAKTPAKLQQSAVPPAPPKTPLAASNSQHKVFGLRSGSKTVAARPVRSKPSLSGLFSNPLPPAADKDTAAVRSVRGLKKVSPTFSDGSFSATSTASRFSTASSKTSALSETGLSEPTETAESPKAQSSSSVLRETIAKAKAARRAIAQSGALVPSEKSCDVSAGKKNVPPTHGSELETPSDLFNCFPSSSKGLLRKRIDAARTDGRLNISAMGLKIVPREVLTMYDSEAMQTAIGAWYECVDLVRFVAADNEFEQLEEDVFPDTAPGSIPADDDDYRGNQFAGLETLDLHGNILGSIPTGLRKLERLTTLNLSNNNLSNDSLKTISQIRSLRDLRLATNALTGSLPEGISQLSKLIVLDLRGNALDGLPESLAELVSLRVINLAENKFTSLPWESLSRLALAECIASRNSLVGPLFPAAIVTLPNLQMLEVANNALTALTHLACPNMSALQQLNISNNRIGNLPDISSWTQLNTIAAENNKMNALPDGFTALQNLKNVNLIGNNLTKIDERVGLMENLEIFRIGNNPLRQRKLLTMTTEDLKRELRNRLSPEESDANVNSMPENSEHSSRSCAVGVPSISTWPVKPGGVLDRSSTKLRSLEASDLEPVNARDEVRHMILQHNSLSAIPITLSLVASTITSLNLAHNELRLSDYVEARLTLPRLKELVLSSNTITSLNPLLDYLETPQLNYLDVSYNRLTALPILRNHFTNLTTLLASDNAIRDLNFEAVRGLGVLDVSRNDIGHLPPRLGLLDGELKTLAVSGNRFRVPRYTLLEKGTDATLAWLRDRIPVGEKDGEIDSLD